MSMMTGETIPIRLFLGGFDLTPTFRDVNKKFSTRYYLNLVLIDEENRRYFKQQEITVFRIPEVRVFIQHSAFCTLLQSSDDVLPGLNRTDTIHLAGNGFLLDTTTVLRTVLYFFIPAYLIWFICTPTVAERHPQLEEHRAPSTSNIRALRGYI